MPRVRSSLLPRDKEREREKDKQKGGEGNSDAAAAADAEGDVETDTAVEPEAKEEAEDAPLASVDNAVPLPLPVDMVRVVNTLALEVQASKAWGVRSVSRVLPLQTIVSGYTDNIISASTQLIGSLRSADATAPASASAPPYAGDLCDTRLPSQGRFGWCVEFRQRSNNSTDKQTLSRAFHKEVMGAFPGLFVSLSDPYVTALVEVFTKYAGVSFLPQHAFVRLERYNLRLLAETDEERAARLAVHRGRDEATRTQTATATAAVAAAAAAAAPAATIAAAPAATASDASVAVLHDSVSPAVDSTGHSFDFQSSRPHAVARQGMFRLPVAVEAASVPIADAYATYDRFSSIADALADAELQADPELLASLQTVSASATPPLSGVIDFTHTFAPVEARGRGLAESVSVALLQWAHAERLAVVATCSYVQSKIAPKAAAGSIVPGLFRIVGQRLLVPMDAST
jgi:predicted GNAT family acetyltransferase